MSDLPAVLSPVEHYARIVRERARRRGLQAKAYELFKACSNGHETHELEAEAMAIARSGRDLEVEQSHRVVDTEAFFDRLHAELASPGRKIRTFMPALDSRFGGILPGEVLCVIARPRVGKSALASQIALNAARANEPVTFFTLEMPGTQALLRMTQQANGWSERQAESYAHDSWKGAVPKAQAQLLAIRERVLFVESVPQGLQGVEMALEEQDSALNRPAKLVIVDYLGLMGSGGGRRSLYERISEAATETKKLAKRAGVAVIMLSQAGRDQDPERSEGAARLGLDSARDSGQIEEAADFIVTLWRPELSKKMSEWDRREVAGRLMGSLVKNRRGPEGDFIWTLDKPTLEITETVEGER